VILSINNLPASPVPVAAQSKAGLRLLAWWDCEFESHGGHMSLVSVMLSGRGLCNELINRPEEPYWLWCVVVCDLETSWMRRPWPKGGGGCFSNKKFFFIRYRENTKTRTRKPDATIKWLTFLRRASSRFEVQCEHYTTKSAKVAANNIHTHGSH